MPVLRHHRKVIAFELGQFVKFVSSVLNRNGLPALPQAGANFFFEFGEVAADERQIKRAENGSVGLAFEKEAKTFLEQLVGRTAFGESLEVLFGYAYAMMRGVSALYGDHPFIPGRMLYLNCFDAFEVPVRTSKLQLFSDRGQTAGSILTQVRERGVAQSSSSAVSQTCSLLAIACV